ncbi:MAG: type IV pilin [Candidatus Bathyarchaeia archaeon]
MEMKLLKNRKALSTVVTTLIILVVSVLLATVVTFYAINVTTTRVQEESLQIANLHVWCNSSGTASAAFVITNTGGRDAVIDKITIRGVRVTDIWYKVADTMEDPQYHSNSSTLSGYTPLGNRSLVLPSGSRMIVYLFGLKHLSTSDIGVSVGVVVFTANAQYYKETNVEAKIP